MIVSVSLAARLCLCNHVPKLYKILCACCLDPPLAALRCVMYFRFMNDVIFARNWPAKQ